MGVWYSEMGVVILGGVVIVVGLFGCPVVVVAAASVVAKQVSGDNCSLCLFVRSTQSCQMVLAICAVTYFMLRKVSPPSKGCSQLFVLTVLRIEALLLGLRGLFP